MKKLLVLAIVFWFASTQSYSQTVTWAKDIAPIFYKNCTSCHHDGGVGHFSLMHYPDAFSHSYPIQYKTENRQMPPWPPDPAYRKFKDEKLLTDAEIQLIKDWVTQGAIAGDTTQAPQKPVYSNLPVIQNADKVMQMPTFTVNANYDLYQCFVLDPQLTQDKYMDAYEVIPGNPEIVHHVLIYEDTTNQSTIKDGQSIEPGYVSFGGIGVSNAKLVGAWVPGSEPQFFPKNMGVLIHKGAKLVMQIHYPLGSSGKADSTALRVRFASNTLREITLAPALNYSNGGNGGLLNGPLSIEADEVKTFYNRFSIPNNYPKLSLIMIAPHMHLIGKSIAAFAVTPTDDTIPLIDIPRWDFHWQMTYYTQKPVILPPGSKLFGKATYDNTANNPFQPSIPPKKVTAGEATTDEMFLIYFGIVVYQNGDENFIIDSSLIQNSTAINEPTFYNIVKGVQLYEPTPNPAKDAINLSFYLPAASEVDFTIYDLNGRIVKQIPPMFFNAGMAQENTDIDELAIGTYIVQMQAAGQTKSKQLVITR